MVEPYQPNLFRLARKTDPETSREAAQKMIATGARRTQRNEVFRVLIEHPGSTSAEVAARLRSRDRYVASRRLPDLEADGFVRRGEARRCKVNGTNAITWFPVHLGEGSGCG